MSKEDTKTNIVDPKYRETMKNKPKDWLAKFIETNCIVEKARKDKKPLQQLNLNKLFQLAKANHVPNDNIKSWKDQTDRPGATGRLRMTVGNALRARARKRHGLKDLDGKFVKADAEFVGDSPLSETPDGEKIKKKAPADQKAA